MVTTTAKSTHHAVIQVKAPEVRYERVVEATMIAGDGLTGGVRNNSAIPYMDGMSPRPRMSYIFVQT